MVARRVNRLSIIALTAQVSLLAVPMAARGCTGEQPTFAEAVSGAEAIALVSVEDVSSYGEPTQGETYRVITVLKGSLPHTVQLDEPRTSICDDTVGLYAPEGTRAIVAFGVPFYDAILHTVWVETTDVVSPIVGSAAVPDGLSTLGELEAAITAALPDTAMAAADVRPMLLLIGTCLVGLALMSVLAAKPVRQISSRVWAGRLDPMPRTPTVESLLDHLFGHAAATPLREELGDWLGVSSRYRRFIDEHRDKARKKLRGAADLGAQLDVRAELWAASLLLGDRRIGLGWEAYGSTRGGPDFTVTYRSGGTFNLEVTRMRHAEAAVSHGGPMLSKLRQLPTGAPNALLTIVDEGPGLDPAVVARSLRARADEKDEPFFVQRGFRGTRDFYDRFLRLGAVIVRADAAPTAATVWVNPSARIPVPGDALRAAVAALGR